MNSVISFFSAYKIIAHIDSHCILFHKQNKQYFLYKEILINNAKEIVEQLQKHRALEHQYLLNLIDYQIDHQMLKIFYKIGKISLKEYIKQRTSQKIKLNEQELWGILYGVVLPLAYLQRENIGYCSINLDVIYLTEDNKAKILDPSISSNPHVLNNNQYYSPQLLNLLVLHQQNEINVFKSDVFTLAMCILNCGLLRQIHECINYKTGRIDFDMLQNIVCEMGNHYSYELMNLIVSMLDENAESRPDFSQLEKILKKVCFKQQEINNTKEAKILVPDIQDQSNQIQICGCQDIISVDQSGREQKQQNDFNIPLISKITEQSFLSTNRNFKDNTNMRTSTNYQIIGSNRHQNIRVNPYLSSSKFMLDSFSLTPYLPPKEQKQLFTDPELMKILKQDLKKIQMRSSMMTLIKENRDINFIDKSQLKLI